MLELSWEVAYRAIGGRELNAGFSNYRLYKITETIIRVKYYCCSIVAIVETYIPVQLGIILEGVERYLYVVHYLG